MQEANTKVVATSSDDQHDRVMKLFNEAVRRATIKEVGVGLCMVYSHPGGIEYLRVNMNEAFANLCLDGYKEILRREALNIGDK